MEVIAWVQMSVIALSNGKELIVIFVSMIKYVQNILCSCWRMNQSNGMYMYIQLSVIQTVVDMGTVFGPMYVPVIVAGKEIPVIYVSHMCRYLCIMYHCHTIMNM